jgi:hypothetical protein
MFITDLHEIFKTEISLIQPCLIRQVNNYLCRTAPAWLASRPALPLSAENSFYSSPFTFYNSHNPTIDFASSKPEYYA